MIFPIDSFTNRIYGLFRQSTNFFPQSIPAVIKRGFEGVQSFGSYAIRKHPVYTLGGVALFTCINVFAYRCLIQQKYPATKEESFRLLQQEALNGQDIQKRVNNDPHLAPLRTFIIHIAKLEVSREKGHYIINSDKREIRRHVLCVLLGIKPALALWNKSIDSATWDLIESVSHLNSSCRIERNGDYYYLCNEHPLDYFDPRKYIKPEMFPAQSNSILEALRLYFPSNHRNDPEADQFLSYLLGYGPSWEDFQRHNGLALSSPDSTIFTEEHYKELGIASGEASPEKYIEAGKASSQEKEMEKGDGFFYLYSHLGINCIITNGQKTPYFKKLLWYCGQIECAFSSLVSQSSECPPIFTSEAIQQELSKNNITGP